MHPRYLFKTWKKRKKKKVSCGLDAVMAANDHQQDVSRACH